MKFDVLTLFPEMFKSLDENNSDSLYIPVILVFSFAVSSFLVNK